MAHKNHRMLKRGKEKGSQGSCEIFLGMYANMLATEIAISGRAGKSSSSALCLLFTVGQDRPRLRCGSSSLNKQQKWKRNVRSNIYCCCCCYFCCWSCQVFGKVQVSGRQATSRERKTRRRNCNLLRLIWDIPAARPCHIQVCNYLQLKLYLFSVSVSLYCMCNQADNLSQRVSSYSRCNYSVSDVALS